MTTKGIPVVWGIPAQLKPLAVTPPGKLRFRFRHGHVAHLFVRDGDGISQFVILDKGEVWGLHEIGRNQKK